MNDEQYLAHCKGLLKAFTNDMVHRTREMEAEDNLRQIVMRLAADDLDIYQEGPALVSRLFTHYPDFAPLFPRDLLWFLGGECLHFMPDEEIERYHRLDEMRREAAERGETLDLIDAQAKLQGLQ